MDITALDTIEKCIPVIDDIINNYCIDHNKDINNLVPNVWNDILYEIYINIFKNNNLLYETSTRYKYNIEIVNRVYNEIYKRLCNRYNLPCSVYGFSMLTGINRQHMYEWLNTSHSDIVKNIAIDNEESLQGLLLDKSYNPMKVLPILNHKHGWSLPGVSRENAVDRVQSISALPSLDALPSNNSHNIGQITSNED